MISELLAHRARYPRLYAEGTYEPLEASGPDADRIVAFERKFGSERLFVAVAVGPWRTGLTATLGESLVGVAWRDVLRKGEIAGSEGLADMLGDGLPFVVLAVPG